MSAHFHFHHPEPDGTTCHLHEEIISIGRSPENSLHLNHPSVSGRHAELTLVDGGFRITDQESTNGTWLNDRRISSEELRDGDEVRFGEVRAIFLAGIESLAPVQTSLGNEEHTPPNPAAGTAVRIRQP